MVPKRTWGLLVAGVGVASIVFGMWYFESEDGASAPSAEPPAGWQAPARSYPTANGNGSGGAVPEPADERDTEVATMIETWRSAILQRDADTVVRLDLSFRETPDRYLAALVESARLDANERVRAFSTRELGKLARTEVAPQLGQLLGDTSPHVRQNAAWALGELGNVPGGRAAARSALPDLKRAQTRDPVGDVRSAARSALAKLQ
jgi:hypothetical protein